MSAFQLLVCTADYPVSARACQSPEAQPKIHFDAARLAPEQCKLRLNRLARSIIDLRAILDELAANCVGFRCLQQRAIDTTTSDGKLLLNILGRFAEFEADIRKVRQADGIAKAKAKGVYKGRPPKIDKARIRELMASGVAGTEVARRLKISRASVYRALD